LCCEPDSDQGISGSTAQPSSVALIYRLPFVLTLIGIFVIFLGVKCQKNEKKITEAVIRLIPPGLKPLLPMER